MDEIGDEAAQNCRNWVEQYSNDRLVSKGISLAFKSKSATYESVDLDDYIDAEPHTHAYIQFYLEFNFEGKVCS